ncbi:MAG TPA: type VI secretion system baseplate subunit TssE [Pirellula sp.]|nr:type VI secretion system baseplate subunit TssE [Pirellula sp.]
MSRIRPNKPLVPSLLDRLLDDAPDESQEPTRSQFQLLGDLKLSVRRDLEYLLNTRVCLREIPDDCEEVKTSVLNFGIPDFSGVAMGSGKQQEILRARVEDVIQRFETRFKQVRVELIMDSENKHRRTIHFRIDGILHAEPAPVPVAFDSIITPIVGQFQVRASDL